MEEAVDAIVALMYNSLEWSLKCNSDGDVIAETL